MSARVLCNGTVVPYVCHTECKQSLHTKYYTPFRRASNLNVKIAERIVASHSICRVGWLPYQSTLQSPTFPKMCY